MHTGICVGICFQVGGRFGGGSKSNLLGSKDSCAERGFAVKATCDEI